MCHFYLKNAPKCVWRPSGRVEKAKGGEKGGGGRLNTLLLRNPVYSAASRNREWVTVGVMIRSIPL